MARFVDDDGFELWDWNPELGRSIWRKVEFGEEIFRNDFIIDDTISVNHERLMASQGQRWGDGKVVASVPLNIYFEQLKEAQDQKDHKYMAKWLNNIDNQKFRTFGGTL